jgi:hypothetical protein
MGEQVWRLERARKRLQSGACKNSLENGCRA